MSSKPPTPPPPGSAPTISTMPSAGPAAPSASSATSVTPDRKQALLLEARRERVAWVDEASVPFRTETAGEGDDAMAVLRSTRACLSMRSAADVVEALYGSLGGPTRGEAAQRVKQQLENFVSPPDMKKAISTIPFDASGDGSSGGKEVKSPSAVRDDEFASSYRIFLQKLRSPECAELVVGMKHFVKSFEEMANDIDNRMKKKQKNASMAKEKGQLRNGGFVENDDASENDTNIKQLASAIQSYLDKTFETIQAHPLWKKKESNDDRTSSLPMDKEVPMEVTKQSLDTFIFAKCSKAIWSVLSASDTDAGDDSVEEQLAALQFVTPSHLDIPYLSDDVRNGDAKNDTEGSGGSKRSSDAMNAWDAVLSTPIASLRSIDHQYSPGQMLSHILDVYRGVNDALSSAMDIIEKAKGTMPGADDVLPTLILTVLRAQPRRIASNLRFVDLFATQKQLRGEAGYAYTNLFGAVQFIQDLDFEQHSDDQGEGIDGAALKAKGLSISPEEFRAGLERCRSEAKKTKQMMSEAEHDKTSAAETPSEIESTKLLPTDFIIPVRDVRAARLGGEDVNITWAQRWTQRHNLVTRGGDYGEGNSLDDPEMVESNERKPSAQPPPLPEGFTRSYTFLSTKPDDVRVSDIPQLLQEYRMLVHATETLLAERTAKFNSDHKKYVRRMRDMLESSAAESASK